MSEFIVSDIPPRLTPSPELEIAEPDIDLTRKPTPPLRKSIHQHPQALTWHVNVVPYNPIWSAQFEEIREHLHELFATSNPPASYSQIEHIGSTSVPGLAAKPNIDVLVTFTTRIDCDNAIEALHWEIPRRPPYVKHTQIPDGGGIQGRESFKIYLPEYHPYYSVTPERNIYLIADTDDNPTGRVQIRGYRTLRDVLRQPSNLDLLEEYSIFKLHLGKVAFANGFDYSTSKDEIIRKILERGAWTEAEIEEKENLSRREFKFDEQDAAY